MGKKTKAHKENCGGVLDHEPRVMENLGMSSIGLPQITLVTTVICGWKVSTTYAIEWDPNSEVDFTTIDYDMRCLCDDSEMLSDDVEELSMDLITALEMKMIRKEV